MQFVDIFLFTGGVAVNLQLRFNQLLILLLLLFKILSNFRVYHSFQSIVDLGKSPCVDRFDVFECHVYVHVAGQHRVVQNLRFQSLVDFLNQIVYLVFKFSTKRLKTQILNLHQIMFLVNWTNQAETFPVRK